MILGGEIPPNIRREILNAANKVCHGKPEGCYFSVRSSAVGEDGDLSFAGLHDSYLNVRFGELLSAFKKGPGESLQPGEFGLPAANKSFSDGDGHAGFVSKHGAQPGGGGPIHP